ncbi:BSD domain-containing protein 1-like [Pollicipes pollicipes]|uniref:BSD domain-containing protein 1-like n=1 Tax=Pollicipes pollicipes TaxID=41117 RepID=UPI0018855E7D|nr:BSD domain-containing protein 1-like [Pollicipes pollicipes]
MEGADAAKETVAKAPDNASTEPDKQVSSPAKETAPIPEPKAGEPQTHEEDQRSSESQTHQEDQSMDDVVAGLANVASGWLSGWMKSLEVAKYKSVEVYDMVKKDLSEFTDAVQAETSTMLSSTSQSLRETLQLQDESSAAGQVKKSVSGFLTHVQKAFTPDTMQDDDTEAYVLRDGQPVLLDRLQTELHRLAADPNTYLAEPAEAERARYEAWSAELDLEARQAELSDLLASSRTVLDQYTRLVPAEVSHVLFWHRYLFRVMTEERD